MINQVFNLTEEQIDWLKGKAQEAGQSIDRVCGAAAGAARGDGAGRGGTLCFSTRAGS